MNFTSVFNDIKNNYNPKNKESINNVIKWARNWKIDKYYAKSSHIKSGKQLATIPWIKFESYKGPFAATILFTAGKYEPILSLQSQTDGLSSKEIQAKREIGTKLMENFFPQEHIIELDLDVKNATGSIARAKKYEKVSVTSKVLSGLKEDDVLKSLMHFLSIADAINSNYNSVGFDKELENATEMLKSGYTFSQVKRRIGQNKWKKSIMNKKGSECGICKINNESLLVGSHIKQWSQSTKDEQTDIENGIILCVNHDGVFDKKLITFSEEGEIIISLEITDFIDELNINQSTTLKKQYNNIFKNKYFDWHRDAFNQKEKERR